MSPWALDPAAHAEDEWLEADGCGGFASGTIGGERTRRYHASLLAATDPPAGRFVLVNGHDAWVEVGGERIALTTQRYAPDTTSPEGFRSVVGAFIDPWPTWRFRVPDGVMIRHECFVRHGSGDVVLTWTLEGSRPGTMTLWVRPFLSGRDPHALHHENPAFAFQPRVRGRRLLWTPYPGVPTIVGLANGEYQHDPVWIRRFRYSEEARRGLDCEEDLAAPGWFRFDLGREPATLVWGVDGVAAVSQDDVAASDLRTAERARRSAFADALARSADAYVTRRGAAADRTIVAGYPWFTDWGRDTFISLRGLCLSTGRIDDARRILLSWAPLVDEGLLPNRFPEDGAAPEYNSVDASLWFVIAAHEFLAESPDLPSADTATLHAAVDAILEGMARGTRYGIRLDDDGLLAAGVAGVQLTWMDAKVGDWVVTPRIGKPVEVQALWLNALHLVVDRRPRWREPLAAGLRAFRHRFVNPAGDGLYDVVDVDHRGGTFDDRVRPNQIFAVGGLSFPLVDGEIARRVVSCVERELWTPLGLRTLSPSSAGFAPRYEGGVHERDGAYHQGTVWPWLIGPFIDAWLHVAGDTPVNRGIARDRFLAPLLDHLGAAGIGHVSEIADATVPHHPRGCPFQAWSLAEVLRAQRRLTSQGDVSAAS